MTIKPDRFVVGLAVVTTLLVVLGVASVVVLQRQPTSPPDLTTPSGVVLAFVQAYRAGNDQEADALYSQRALLQVAPANSPGPGKPPVPPSRPIQSNASQRVEVLGTRLNGDSATVDVTITTFRTDSPVFPSEYSYSYSVALVRENGQWRIDQPFFPT